MEVKVIDHMGSDLSVVNAARISFGKRKKVFDQSDEKLIKYLAKHKHWSPMSHTSVTFYMTVPKYISDIISNHKIGLLFTEKSRNYKNYTPEFYKKNTDNEWLYIKQCLSYYSDIYTKYGEQIAMNTLPPCVLSSWYLTGNVYSFSKLYNFHKNGDNEDLNYVLSFINEEMLKLFPESWKSLS